MKRRYFAFVERGPKGNFSAYFPDIDGCVTAGDTLEEVDAMAHEALKFHLEGMLEDGDPIPPPGQYENASLLDGLAALLPVTVELESRTARYNVTLPEHLVSRIDSVASNRSGFLAEAAQEKLDRLGD